MIAPGYHTILVRCWHFGVGPDLPALKKIAYPSRLHIRVIPCKPKQDDIDKGTVTMILDSCLSLPSEPIGALATSGATIINISSSRVRSSLILRSASLFLYLLQLLP